MKTCVKNPLLLSVLVAVLGSLLAGQAAAQTFTTLHSFSADNGTNSDGVEPESGLLLSGNTLYGTAKQGGSFSGTVFALNTDGSSFRTLYDFSGVTDGGGPTADLIVSGEKLYGTAAGVGSANGTVFAVNQDG